MNLNSLIQQRADLWRGNKLSSALPPGVSTGFAALDAQLAGGGWPLGAVTEILADGDCALGLVMPGLARLSQESRWIVFIAPPHIPYAPGLAGRGMDLSRLLLINPKGEQERLWALEQTLRSGACSAVLAWPSHLEMTVLRRLQLAAEAGRAAVFLFRPEWAARQPSPAALRLQVRPSEGGMVVNILKRRGSWAGGQDQIILCSIP